MKTISGGLAPAQDEFYEFFRSRRDQRQTDHDRLFTPYKEAGLKGQQVRPFILDPALK